MAATRLRTRPPKRQNGPRQHSANNSRRNRSARRRRLHRRAVGASSGTRRNTVDIRLWKKRGSVLRESSPTYVACVSRGAYELFEGKLVIHISHRALCRHAPLRCRLQLRSFQTPAHDEARSRVDASWGFCLSPTASETGARQRRHSSLDLNFDQEEAHGNRT